MVVTVEPMTVPLSLVCGDGFGAAAIGVEHGVIGGGVIHLAVDVHRRGLGKAVRASRRDRLAGLRAVRAWWW